MPTIRLIQAPADQTFRTDILKQRLGRDYSVEVSNDASQLDRDSWHVVVLTQESVQSLIVQEMVAQLERRLPDRVVLVMTEPCSPAELHTRLAFTDFIDLRENEAASWDRLVEVLQAKPGSRKVRPLQQIIMFLSLKGGVAKTTNTVAIAEALADQGRNVLVIDTDHQCASSSLLLDEDYLLSLEDARRPRNLLGLSLEMLEDSFSPDQIGSYLHRARTSIPHINDHLSVLPSSLYVEEFALRDEVRSGPRTVTAAISQFRDQRMEGVAAWLKQRFDYILIDCPPALSWQVVVIMYAADSYIIPCIPDRLSTRGAKYLVDRLARLKARLHPLGLIWSLVNGRNPAHDRTIQFAVERDRDLYANLPRPFSTYVPVTSQIRESQEQDLDASERPTTFRKKYKVLAEVYRNVAKELIQRANHTGEGAVRPAVSVV